MAPTIIPFAAAREACPKCGCIVLNLDGLLLEPQAVHGVTERYDATGRVTAYDQLGVYPPHAHPTT